MELEPDASSEPGDRELAERAQSAGDMDAFEALYRRYVGRIHAFAYRRSGSEAVADDVTSATFESALRAIAGFRWRGGGFAPWLFRIASREIADHFRNIRRTYELPRPADDHVTGVEDAVIAGADAALVRDAMRRLNSRYQQAVSLRYFAGLSSAEAADAMGIPRPVMAVTLHRALRALGRELGASS